MTINEKYLPDEYKTIPKDQLILRINDAKNTLGEDLIILGHHYQIDEIIQFSDIKGDSYHLAKSAANSKAKYIVFCGVHFMAESADIVSRDDQIVILPNLDAGCCLADMANIDQVNKVWDELTTLTSDKIIPITYINSTADLKAFCGQNGGIVCTSSNAERTIKWALSNGDRIFFFPDQHLGRNTCFKLGIPLDKMIIWNPYFTHGDNRLETIKNSKVILWPGYCGVHQVFKKDDIIKIRKQFPDIKVIVHPECNFEVVQNSDYAGSTSDIIDAIKNAPKGSRWAIGTEESLVLRLKKQFKETLYIHKLSEDDTICQTMNITRLHHLVWILESIINGNVYNQIKVDENIAKYAKIALDKMLSI